MTIDKEYFIGIYWDVREEGIEICANKIKTTFDFLSSVDISFGAWYQTTRPSKGELLQPLDISIKGIKAFLLKGQNYNDIGELLNDLGYLIYLKSEKDYNKAHVLSITCGCYNELISNCVALTIGGSASNKHLTKKETLEKIYKSLVEIWHPDRGVIRCNDISLLSDTFSY